MSLGDKVLTARKSKGLTQEQLAERAALTVRTIQRIEGNDSIPRDYTLKAIAGALNIPLEEFITVNSCLCSNDYPIENLPVNTHPNKEEQCHFLQMLNLSAFSYLVVPFVHFLIPILLLKKKKAFGDELQSTGRRIIRQQIWWTVSTHLLMLLTLVYNFVQVGFFNASYFLNYIWVFAFMYLLNAVIICTTAIRLRQGSRTAAYANN
jgi:transcriptional regulator with XRE-family HTH domain